jgi:tetratricopeptide (TPR) repeat protein
MSNVMQKFDIERYRNSILGVLLLVGIAVGSWFSYKWYNQRLERQAYQALAEGIETFNKNSAADESDSAKWGDLERAFAGAAERHKNSKLAPYFLAYQAEALIHQGKQQEAIIIMEKMLTQITTQSPLYYYYALKQDLMRLDGADEKVQQRGLQDLKELAQTAGTPVEEEALYYSGLALHLQGDKEGARHYWDMLDNKSAPDSHWRALAQSKVQ